MLGTPQSFLKMGTRRVDLGSLGGWAQLPEAVGRVTGQGLQTPSQPPCPIHPPKKWPQLTCLTAPLSTADQGRPGLQCLCPAPTLTASYGESQSGILASCSWAPARLASPCSPPPPPPPPHHRGGHPRPNAFPAPPSPSRPPSAGAKGLKDSHPSGTPSKLAPWACGGAGASPPPRGLGKLPLHMADTPLDP